MAEEKKDIKTEEETKDSTQATEEVGEEKAVEAVEEKVEEPSTDVKSEDAVEEAGEVEEEVVVEEEVEPLKPGEEKIPEFRVGDTIKINYKIIEGDKTRIQPYQGIVIAIKGSGVSKTFTVRKISVDRVGVERIFPICSPNIEGIKVVKKGIVRRAKLYYLRGRVGKQATRIKERK
jgi:large subunit ribosomal protein L19